MLVLALAAQFAFGTDARRAFSPASIAALSGLFSAVGILLVSGPGRGLRVTSPMAVTVPFILGAGAFVAAPALVMFHRYSDAPQGSEVLFLTTAVWGASLALLSVTSWRRLPLTVFSAVLGLAGVAGIVANWERPSSFSLFIRYRAEEAWMIAAGVIWALLWLWMSRQRERDDVTRSALAASAGAIVGGLVLALGRGVTPGELVAAVTSPGMLVYCLACGVVSAAAVMLVRASGAGALAGASLLPAAALTVVTLVEQATTPLGPQPILLGPATAGAVIALAACVLLWTRDAGPEGPRKPALAAAIAAGIGALAGVAALVTPALEAHVTGLRTSGQHFEMSYVMSGFEVVGPWVALGLAGIVLALALWAPARSAIRSAAVVAAGAAWPLVWATPLHTLTTFVPSEVQVDFGSEFASITFSKMAIPASLIALAGAGVGLALLLVGRSRSASEPDSRGGIS